MDIMQTGSDGNENVEPFDPLSSPQTDPLTGKPVEPLKPAYQNDEEQLRRFFTWLWSLAEQDRLFPHKEWGAGNFVVFATGEVPVDPANPEGDWTGAFGTYVNKRDQTKSKSLTFVIPNDQNAVEAMVDACRTISLTKGANTYVSVGLFKDQDQWANQWGRGTVADVIRPLAIVGDFDKGRHDDAVVEGYADRMPFAPSAPVETSPGSFQPWTALVNERAIGDLTEGCRDLARMLYGVQDSGPSIEDYQHVFQAFILKVGGDHGHSIEHIFRVPGTAN